MPEAGFTDRGTKRNLTHIALALSLALTTLAVVLLSAGVARPPVLAQDTEPVGPLCFYRGGQLDCIAPTTSSGDASPRALLEALLQGPSPEVRAQGFESAIPNRTRLASVVAAGQAVTVQLTLPDDYWGLPAADMALAAEAVNEQIAQTLFSLGYRDFAVRAEDPDTPGVFRPISAYLPPLNPPRKPHQAPLTTGQPPVESKAPPQGALSGKTVYVSAGHGWQWNGYAWRTQRPPYPDATTGYEGPIIEDHNNAQVVNQYLLRYLRNAGADVWTARERDMNSFESIADETGAAVGGTWTEMAQDGYAARYLMAATAATASAAVTWTTAPVAADGEYALYVWYVSALDRAPDAHYTVHHAGGATELSVDQRRHGQTWRYVGRFPVRAGRSLTVVLDNRSTAPGTTVAADAVRLGGGRFDNSDLRIYGGAVSTTAPYAPDKPWWEAAAYYQVQRLGIDPDGFEYFNDVIARPIWARWEHADTGDDAVYISWHTNGYNGHNETFWGTTSYIHSDQPVTGSAALRHAIHTELVNDARAGWDPEWRDLGEASKDLGELRELWDAQNPANAIPGVLLEVAYHDHVGDTDALKDPRFALLSARAVYQGIVKYFESRDGVDLTLLPEPPTHLVVRNSGPGRVTVSWRPSPTDTLGLVGDPAESYRVYTSRDGLGWDDGRTVVSTSLTLTGLQTNELVFVRVTALNAGGESFPTPVLAARVSLDDVGHVLLVDGFDRIDRHGLPIENDPVEGTNALLLPDLINSFDYVIEHGQAITLPFDSAVNEAVADGDVSLALYNIVDWILGEESTIDHTFDAAEQAALAAYLEGGGALFVSGAEIGWDLAYNGNGVDFYPCYLGTDYAGDDAGTYAALPTDDGIFAGLGTIYFRDNYDVDYPDQLTPLSATAALEYAGGNGGVAAVQWDAGGCRRVVYLGFPFETIDAAQRPAVMARALGYLGADGCITIGPQTAITSPVNSAALNEVPDFAGTASGYNPIARVEVQINDPHGRYWDGQTWVTASRWLTALGGAAWTYSLPPTPLSGTAQVSALAQGEYRLWARAWDTAALSDTTPALTRFIYDTVAPATPMLIAPADGIILSGAPVFAWAGPLSDTGSALAYRLQIDDQFFTRTGTTFTATSLFATGVHTWRVQAVDAAGNLSPWTPAWAFFADRHTAYLPWVLKQYTPPQPPACVDIIVNGGFETDEAWSINGTALPAAYATALAHTGTRSMRLGIVPPSPGTGAVSYSSVDQTLPVPAGISATLTFWLYPFSESADADDLQYAGLYDDEGVWRFLWTGHLDATGWVSRTADLTPYLGQVINLRFSVKNDGDDDTAAVYLDDVRLEVCGQ